MPDLIQLDEKRLKQLDGSIKQMVSSGASEDDVMKYAFDFKNQFGLKKKDGGQISSPTELPSVSQEEYIEPIPDSYFYKGQELVKGSFLKKVGEPDRSKLVSQYKSPDISLTQKPKKDYYSTKLEKGLIFDKEGQLYAPSSEALSKDITAAEQASLKKSTQKDLVEKSREMPVVQEPTEEQGLLLNLVSSLDRGFAKNFISNPMKGLGTFLQGTTKNVLGGSGEGAISDALIKYGDYLNIAIDELTPQDEEYKNSLWDQAAQALGQVGSLILTGGLTGASGKAAALVAQAPKGAVATAASRIGSQLSAPTSISAGLSMGQAEFDRAIQAGATDDQAFEVFYKNAVTGSVLETIPVMQFFKRFNKSTAGGLVNYLKTKGVAGFTGGVEEMTTEILQQVYANKTAKDIYNINQSILDGVGSSGGIGFGVGFLLNAMGANARILRKQGKEQDAVAIENQIEQYENNLKNPKVTSGNTAKDIVTQGVEIGTQKAVQDLDRDLANNVITPEKYQEGIAFAEKAAQVVDKIPETVTGESRVKSIELLVERNDIKQANQNLLQQKQSTDEAYHAGIDEEIKANEEKIKEIDAKVYDIAKKPSKEFGDKKYTVDGEEVSQEAFEALQGKPIGTKTIVEPTEVKDKVVGSGVGEDVMKGMHDKMRQTELEMEFAGQDAVLDFKNNDVEIIVAKPLGLSKYQVAVSEKSNSNTGFTLNEGKTKLFDTKLEALEYAKEQKEQSLKEKSLPTKEVKPTEEIDIYDHQDKNAEIIVSDSKWKGQVWRYKFENAGDILRELAKYKNEFLDPGYIYEKVDKIREWLDKQKERPIHIDDSYGALKEKDSELLNKLKNSYKNQPVLTEAQQKAKDLVLNLIDGNLSAAENQVKYFEQFKGDDARDKLKEANLYPEQKQEVKPTEVKDGFDYVRNKFIEDVSGGKRLSDKESNILNKEVDKLIERAEKENGVKRNELKQSTWETNDGYTVTEFFENGRGGTRITTPKGEEINIFDNKYKGESGKDISYFPKAAEVKPTEVEEEVVKPEVKKSKLEAYKEKYAQKQKIEPIKIEDNGNPIIAKDPAENDIAIAKLAKQDNPIEEPSIKVIESQGANAENIKDKELTESIGQVDDKIKLATRIEMVAMTDLKTDEASFQNREGLNLKKVDDIVANYNPSEFDPIIYWTDASGQKYTLNHHRFAAAQKLKLDEIPAQKLTYPLGHPKEFQVVPATDKAEAIDFAINRSNANRSMETAVERAKALRKLQKTGTKEEVNKFLEREGKNKTKIQNIAALNENGKTIDALKMFGDAEDVQLQKETEQRSDWIGEARRRISGLTNEHENEMFDFLMDKDASKRITSKADFISKVTSLAGGFDFNPENPLNLKRFKYQTEGERAYDEVTGQLKSEIDTRQTKIDDLKARFSDPSRRDYIPTNSRDYEQTKKIADDQISKLNTEIKSFQQKLQDHYKEKGKYQGGIEQGGLFATEQATSEEINDMADIVKDFYDDGMVKLDDIKKEVAKELGFNNKSLEDVVERAYNKMVMEYTPVEISKGVIGKVGEKLNALGEDGVVMLEDDQSIFAKAAQLAETGGRVEFQATLPNGEKVTAKPVDASVVNGFYSPLELQINQMKADKMPAKQWLDKLKGEEAKWTGLADWLSQQQGSLSKQEIKDWLQDNQIEINEIVKGRAEDLTQEQLDGLKYLAKIDAENPILANFEGLLAENVVYKFNGILNPTKFSNLQLEGEKEDYAEILVTLPIKNSLEQRVYSSHYDEADILVHLRMNIRKDAQGKKVLFLEEVQSDWGQKGKKEGFQSGDLQKLGTTRILAREEVKKIDQEIDEYYYKNKTKKIELNDAEENAYENISAKMRNGVATEEEIAERQLYIEKDTFYDTQYDLAKRDKKFNDLLTIKGEKLVIMRNATVAYDKASPGKPTAPFVTDTNAWTKLGLKVALKEAVKQGVDKIAWTTGEQQVGRYEDNFRKQVDNIDSERFEAEAGKPSRVRIIAYKSGKEVFNELLPIDGKTNIKGKDVSIDDIVGKDIAQKIREGEDQQSFTGNQLTIGGSGMKGFYGSASEGSLGILGNMAKSLFKQEPSKISIISSEARIKELQKEMDLHQEHQTYFLSRRDDAYDNGDKEKALEMYALANKSGQLKESVLSDIGKIWKYRGAADQLQYSINITPELKAQVEVGLPLFMAKPNGDILGFTYGKTIYLNASKINPNTPIHEGGHIWTRWVKKNDTKVYDRGMELVKNTKYLERAKSSKFYQEQAAKLPQAEREAYFQEEALAMAIGDKGAQFVAEAKKSSFKEWLDNLWDTIKNAAGFDNITAKELQNLTFDEFAKRAARDILSPKSEQLKPTQNAIVATAKKEQTDLFGNKVQEQSAKEKGDEEAVRMRSLYKQVITRSKGLTEEQKSILKNDPNALYTVLPIAESKRIALELIQEMGVAEAVAEASSSTTTLQPVERTMILGAAMDYYAKLGKEKLKDGDMSSAQAAARKEIDANEELRRVASTLGQLGTDYGRAINAFKEIYKLSSLALERKLVKDVEELNEEREEGATEDAKQIKKIITEDASDIEDVADELTNEEVESKLDAAKKVSDLEKQVEDLRKQILERDKAQKGTKNNPLRIKRITNDTEYDKRLKDFKQRARSIASKDDLVDLTYFGLYHIENGVTKFVDWYKEMSKNFKGFRSQFKNIYNSVAEKAAENGADRNMFDNDETIQSVLDDFQQETDAKKIVQATKKVAQAKLKREEENNPERAVKIAPSLAAERIRKDAEKNLDMPSTEVEQTYLKRLVKVINNKAKEYYAEKKENISNVNDVLAFAIANGKKDFAIWERTQTELEEQIDEDEKLTEDEKEEVKDFLQAYRESIFETLLTKNQISEAVREKLIENGYFVERIVKGTPIKSVDWSKITGNASTLKEAKEKIVKSITDLGFTEAQAKGEINAILDYFDAKISEKKTAEINKYLQKGILNKVKALGKKKVKRNSVDKLVELNKKGLLDDAKIKEILAAELGLMEITNDDLKNLRDWSSKVDDENTPIFIRKEFEEKIQYLFDTKSGNINYLENRSASMSNRLSSVVNQVINLLGSLRAVSTLETVAYTTGKPIVAARVFLKELVNAAQEAKTIMKGRVSRGSSFDDLIGTASGQPRVRYLEQGKGKFLGSKGLGKPIYVQIGGNKVDLNPINFGYSKIKYISRLLESADTMASGPISGVTQFRIATKEINRYYPQLSAAQRSQKVYNILYTVDMAVEMPKAIKDLKNAGVSNPTEAEINRTINERVERARGQRLAEELYQAAKSLNLISETKLKSDGIVNPTEDEILAQSYKTLGSTQAADLVARGERQAARETGKMTTRGITSIILLPVDMVQKSLNSGLKSNSKAVTTLSEIGDVSFSVLMPFANSIARWAEMTAELFAPYGIAKGAAYKIGAKFTSKKSKISAEEYSDLGDDYLIRGTQGLVRTLLIMYALGMLNKAEDDEQEELGKSFTGTAREKQYAQEKVQSVGKPKQSVNILGTNVSLAFLGNQGLAIGMYADFLKLRSKRKLDENMTERGELFISSLAAMEAFGGFMFDATYLNTAKKYGSAASSLIEMKEEGYMPTLGRIAGGIISSQIPFNRLQVEAATLFNPKSQSSKDFGSNLLAQMSITRAFQSGKPNFDYRGREYDYGDIYANSADGIRKMFGKAKYGDEIDAFLSEINFAATDAYRETRDEDNYRFSILNPDDTKRFMTNEEYYEFKKKTANKFNEYIKEDYKDIKDEVVDEGSLADVQKQIVSQLLSDAKSNAFIEIQELTGYDDAQYLRQLAKEKEKAQKVISKIKKYYKK